MSLGIDLLALTVAQMCLLGIYLFLMIVGFFTVTIYLYRAHFMHYIIYGIKVICFYSIRVIKYFVNEMINYDRVNITRKL